MRAVGGRMIVALSIVPVLACRSEPPVRLVAGVHDTVIVNSARAQPIPVDAIDRRGNAHPVEAAHFRWISGDTVHVSEDGSVRCQHSADAVVQASIADVSTTFVLYCRPMRGFAFGMDHSIGVFVDGPPRELDILGDGTDHRPVTLIAARLRVLDSSIAVVDHGRIVPRRPGTTRIDIEAGDARTSYFVEVLAKANEPSRLRPHEAFVEHVSLDPAAPRTWRIPRGRYEIRFLPDAGGHSIAIATTSANCSRYGDGAAHLSCVAGHDTDVIVAVLSPAHEESAVAGMLVIRCLADPPQITSYFLNVNYLAGR